MRCLACNCNLSDYESTRKSAATGEFIDLCNRCFSSISNEMHTIERADLEHSEENDDLGVDKDDFI
jgi:hypothetical protein